MAKYLFLFVFLFSGLGAGYAQAISMQQDSTLNNLVLANGTITCKTGEAGKINKTGKGKQSIILIAGFGFGEAELRPLISHLEDNYTIYTITAAGFAGTAPPSIPDSSVKYSQLTWTRGIVKSILQLIQTEKLIKPCIIAHFVIATQAALILESDYPDKIGKVIIISGSPYRYYASQQNGLWTDWEHEYKLSPAQRENLVEKYWAPEWFKTITKKTWDENMWTPEDYCSDKNTGEAIFNSSAAVPVQVMIRYILEWMAYDPGENYKRITTPTLLLIPDFKNIFTVADSTDTATCKKANAKQYLKYFHQQSWQDVMSSGNPAFHFQKISNTGIFMWLDNPEQTFQSIDAFLNKLHKKSE